MYLAAGRLVGRHRVVELVGMGDVVTTDRHDLRSVLVNRREGGREGGRRARGGGGGVGGGGSGDRGDRGVGGRGSQLAKYQNCEHLAAASHATMLPYQYSTWHHNFSAVALAAWLTDAAMIWWTELRCAFLCLQGACCWWPSSS